MAVKRASQVVSAGGVVPSNGSLWEAAPALMERRVVFMSIYGDTGTGRTSLALTAPGPVALCHAGEKIDGIVQVHYTKVRTLNFGCVLSGSEEQIAAQAAPVWDRLYSGMFDAYNWAKSTVLDTETEAWELIRVARFGTLKPRGRTDNLYGPVNAEWRSPFKRFRQQDATNIIVIGQTKDEYKDRPGRDGKVESNRTGKTIRAGQKEMPFLADVVIRTSRGPAGEFYATVEKGWFNAAVEGTTYVNDEIRFSTIMADITGIAAEEWDRGR